MIRFFLAALAVMLSLAATTPASAGVLLDDFSSSNGTIGTFGGVDLNRSTNGLLFTNFGVASQSDFQLTYETSGGVFGDFTDGASVVEFSVATFGLATFEYSVYTRESGGSFVLQSSGNPVPLNASADVEMDIDLSNLDALRFEFTLGAGPQGGGYGVFGGNFTAVPEPTSLALVGLALGGLGLRRRRRS